MASRPVWRGFLRFSLVSVPVALYSAGRSVSETIKLNQLHAACNSRIQHRKTCPQHGEVTSDDIVTGYEFEEGKFVIVDASEIEKIRPPKEKGINVAAFITDGSIDARYFTGRSGSSCSIRALRRGPAERPSGTQSAFSV